MNKKLKLKELQRDTLESYARKDKVPLIMVLDNIRSGHNVGSVFRTSDAYLIQEIYLCGITAQPPQKDIEKTAIGATDSVEWCYFENTLDAINSLKEKGFQIISIEQTEKSILLDQFIPEANQKIAVVMGNEVKGVDQKIIDASDHCIELPQFGTKHSLNVSVCSGIVIWELSKKMTRKS